VVHEPSESNQTREPARVLKFRLRDDTAAPQRRQPDNDADEAIDDLAQYEQDDGEIDYRHRMMMNIIAVVIVALLVGVGVWIADTMADIQRIEDCAMQGRQNCAPIEIPPPKR